MIGKAQAWIPDLRFATSGMTARFHPLYSPRPSHLSAKLNLMSHDSYPDSLIREVMTSVKRIALVGASANEARPSWIVTKYLIERG